MDQIDKQELPGNDASWYEALVADQASRPPQEVVEGAGAVAVSVMVDTAADLPRDSEVEEFDTAIEPAPDDATAADGTVDTAIEDDSPTESDADAAETEPDTTESDVDTAETVDAAIEDDAPTETEPDTVESGEVPVVAAVPSVAEDDSPLENTSEMVGQLWTARDSFGPLDGWEPDDMDRKMASSRSFRWSTLIGILAVVGLIAVGLVLLPSLTQSRADEHLDMLTTAMRDLRSELPDSQTSLSVATDPSSEPSELSSLTTQLTELAAKASTLDEATQADLPKAPPLTSSAPIDAIEPIRQQAEPLGTIALTIQRRISNLVEYRTLMSGFLVLPDLPTTADSATQAELRVELASAQADSAAILSDLPDDVSLAEHEALAREINEQFAAWQVDYLEALRTGDAAAAESLISDLESDLEALDEALVEPLAQIRRQTDADLIDLARDIDEVVALADSV